MTDQQNLSDLLKGNDDYWTNMFKSMKAKPMKLLSPVWKADITLRNGDVVIDVCRMEHSKGDLSYRLERQSFAMPKRLIDKILKAK